MLNNIYRLVAIEYARAHPTLTRMLTKAIRNRCKEEEDEKLTGKRVLGTLCLLSMESFKSIEAITTTKKFRSGYLFC